MENYTPFEINLHGDNAWPDLQGKPYKQGMIKGATVLGRGTEQGRPAVAFRIETDDGEVIIAQTTLRLFALAAQAFVARYPAYDQD